MKTICVYCGSSLGKQSDYAQAAEALAEVLLANQIDLVYGGASIGVMGAVADAVLAGGGNVTGVIPQALAEKEVAHAELTALHVVASMHDRKAMMADLSDGFIALPGGLGTLEELFEVLTWAQLGFHQKPCGILNTEGYYDGLITFLQHATDEKFIKPIHQSLLLVDDDPSNLIQAMLRFQPIDGNKWLERDEI